MSTNSHTHDQIISEIHATPVGHLRKVHAIARECLTALNAMDQADPSQVICVPAQELEEHLDGIANIIEMLDEDHSIK